MPIPRTSVPSREADHTSHVSEDLFRFLYRPIVFREPDRVVHPPSWLEHIPFAFWIVDVLRPDVFVELGTHSGNSYAALAQAVQMLELPAAGYAVDSWKGDSQAGFYNEDVFTEWAVYHERHFSAFSRLIRSTFAEAAAHFADGSIDLLHFDGCHTYEAVSADFNVWRPKLSRRGVILIHDINVRERDFGAWRLWEELKAEFPSFEFLHSHGLGVVAAGSDLPKPLQWLFSTASGDPTETHKVRQFFSQLGGAISSRFATRETELRLRGELDKQADETRSTRAALDAREAQLLAQSENLSQLRQESLRLQEQLAAATADREQVRGQLAVSAADCVALKARLQGHVNEAHRLREQAESERAAFDAQLEEERTRAGSERDRLVSELEARGRMLRAKTRLIAELEERRRSEVARHQPAEASGTWAGGLQERLRTIPALRGPLQQLRAVPKTMKALGRGTWQKASHSWLNLLTRPSRLLEAHLVQRSGLFDETYYLEAYPDVAASRLSPIAHYVLEGAREGRNPHWLFDGAYYLRRNPDVALARVNPLLHYRKRGALEGRNPHPLFDVGYYLANNPDVKRAGAEPLGHFLRFGAKDGRNPNPFFDSSYYRGRYADVAATGTDPLLHFIRLGWREGRRTSQAFDAGYYAAQNPDIPRSMDPLAHYLEHGRFEGRQGAPVTDDKEPVAVAETPAWVPVQLTARSLFPSRREPPTVVCLSHVSPVPPRAGNEYRIYRLLRWLRNQGYRVVPVIAPLPGVRLESAAVRALGDEFSNAVLCDRDGRLEYVLRDVPDALASLGGELTRPVSALLDEDGLDGQHARQALEIDRVFCHDALVTAVTRLQQALGPHVLLCEYIWMSRILPLVSGDVIKVIDTHDVFSTKREKVLRFGIDDMHIDPSEETRRLNRADLILAIQDDEREALQQLAPGVGVVTAGVDFDIIETATVPRGRSVLCVGSDNPVNKKGLLDFLRFAWPNIRRDLPDAQLIVAGRICDSLDVESPGIVRAGLVEDLAPLYEQARVVINPAVAGTGLKIKTLEALGHLRPIVTWPSGTDGLAPELRAFCVTADDWFDFSRRLTRLLASDEPVVFSRADRDTIALVTSPATTYRAMTVALGDLWEERVGSALMESSIRG